MYDPDDFKLYEAFVEKESKEFPKATNDEELEYWKGLAKGETSEVGVTTQDEGGSTRNDLKGLGAEKVATAEGEEGSAENVATAREKEDSAGNVEGAREEEEPRTRSVVRRIKGRTDRKEKKMEDFEVQIPLKR
ncbi:hypothetical protein ACLB2K_073295 [Fragaria x ananassa]